ncbi:MAG TPA: flagellar hook-basal body complex protein FliE [Candidatus Baltobacteraceae bacterium]|jgi:flagellar hook-basal body complex protein FliE|nr:flagellar hook-basal body complex protein FliE [Candidatus Baltobacteraceae bacterium]
MKIEALIPDSPAQVQQAVPQSDAFSKALDGLGSALESAERSEDAFAAGTGDLQTAVYERARADVALSVATAAAQRSAQALQSILNMQV